MRPIHKEGGVNPPLQGCSGLAGSGERLGKLAQWTFDSQDKSFRFSETLGTELVRCVHFLIWGEYTMITLEAYPEIHVEEQHQRPEYSTCYECHRTFHAKSEDQLCLELCDSCFEDLRSLREPIIS